MDASLIEIGTRADTTDALTISSSLRSQMQLPSHLSSAAEGDQTERNESRPAEAEHERGARVMMIEPQSPASIQGNSRMPCFASNARLFIIATAPRVSVSMDAERPCDAEARAGRRRTYSQFSPTCTSVPMYR